MEFIHQSVLVKVSIRTSRGSRNEGQALVIRNLRLKDYPLLVQVSPLRRVFCLSYDNNR